MDGLNPLKSSRFGFLGETNTTKQYNTKVTELFTESKKGERGDIRQAILVEKTIYIFFVRSTQITTKTMKMTSEN